MVPSTVVMTAKVAVNREITEELATNKIFPMLLCRAFCNERQSISGHFLHSEKALKFAIFDFSKYIAFMDFLPQTVFISDNL